MAAEDNGVINRCANLFLKVRIGFNELRADWAAQPTSSDHIPGILPTCLTLPLPDIPSLNEPRISEPRISVLTNDLVTDLLEGP